MKHIQSALMIGPGKRIIGVTGKLFTGFMSTMVKLGGRIVKVTHVKPPKGLSEKVGQKIAMFDIVEVEEESENKWREAIMGALLKAKPKGVKIIANIKAKLPDHEVEELIHKGKKLYIYRKKSKEATRGGNEKTS